MSERTFAFFNLVFYLPKAVSALSFFLVYQAHERVVLWP